MKSPIELKDKSNVFMQFSNDFSECYPSKASLLSSCGRIADLCSEDGILVKCAGDTKTIDLIIKKILVQLSRRWLLWNLLTR